MINITNCSMGCLYAEGPLAKCFCKCQGSLHGLMATTQPRAYCSPAVAIRCHNGLEDGDCACACKGVNHGLYRGIEGFESVPIVNNLQASI